MKHANDASIVTHLRNRAKQLGTAPDRKACIAIDIQFHRSLVDASSLQSLVAFSDLLEVFFRRFQKAIGKVDSPRKIGVENHLRLVDYLAARQVDAASAELREQIESNEERL